ncbi:MAG: PAS domain S-box protein [Polyangiaceae bacterium]
MTEDERPDHFFERLLDATPDAIVIVDARGLIQLVNEQTLTLFGYAREELIGKAVETLIPERFRQGHPSFRSGYNHAPRVRPMGSANMPLYALRKDGTELHAEISLSPVKMPEGWWAIAAVRDITRQEQQQAALRRATEAAVAANHELEAFSYSVAHDLRSPLRSIDGFSQALLEDYADKLDEEGRQHLTRVRAAAQRMAQLIDDLLGLSRVTRSELFRTEVDVTSMAHDIVDALRRAHPHRDVRVLVQDGLTVHADPRLMSVALENLIGNAWKFTSKCAKATIEIGSATHDGEVVFFVRDDGAGFDMTFVNKLFTAFQRLHTRADFEGTGIGLATVMRIIRRHGGRVWAEGAVDRGATFWFTLPSA